MKEDKKYCMYCPSELVEKKTRFQCPKCMYWFKKQIELNL